MSQAIKDDHVKMHKEANALFESGKFKDAEELFAKTADLYLKVQNYFDSTTMRYKAGECAFALKEYEKAVEHFEKSAELSFQKGFDRFGVSALEYERDCYKSLGKNAKVKVLDKKIQEIKKKLEEAF
jgi:tetratricopeptide (TPR) repeat protein